jgi:uncharacterized membrane protein YhhN
MVFIVAIAFLGQSGNPFYKYMIITGLVFSLAGDIFLMLPTDRFVEGLSAFLIAHLFYIAAFASEVGSLMWWPLIPLFIYSIVVYRKIAKSLGKQKIPVLLYFAVIMVMAWLALERWVHTGQTPAMLAFIGAVLFIASDSILAINRFGREFGSYKALNLSTYFAAQLLIAGSLGFSVF